MPHSSSYRRPEPPPKPAIPILIPDSPSSSDTGLLWVGERPAENELREGRPFAGFSGREADTYLDHAGLYRDQFHITNVVPWYGPPGCDHTPQEYRDGTRHLMGTIYRLRPRLIVAAGSVATSFFLGRKHDLDTLQGKPWEWEKGTQIRGDGLPCYIFPMYHPGAGSHDTEEIKWVWAGIQALGLMLRGTEEEEWGRLASRDEWPRPSRVLADRDSLDALRHHAYESGRLALDTENTVDDEKIWCITASSSPDAGILIPTCVRDGNVDQEALAVLRSIIADPRVTVVLHNAMADLDKMAQVGVELVDGRLRDTMVAAYNLCTEPQALKSLAYRHFAHQMKDYNDLVGPYSSDLAMAYLEEVERHNWGKPGAVLERKGLHKVAVQPQSVNAWAKKIRGQMEKEGGGAVDVRDRWKKVRPSVRELVEEILGPMPVSDVSKVPLAEVVEYAVDDAITTGRLDEVLTRKLESHGGGATANRRPVGVPSLLALNTLDTSIIPYAAQMQGTGIMVDRPYFRRLGGELDESIDGVCYQLFQLCGREVNPDSSQVVSDIIYGKYGVPVTVKTEGGDRGSTNDKILEKIRLEWKDEEVGRDFIPLVQKGREYKKFRDSFVSVLLKSAQWDERVRARWQLTRVSSGRLSCLDPNLMAQPVRAGDQIRSGFIARPGYLIGDIDLDQIEMRWAADDSQDPHLCEIFRAGNIDVHSSTAAMMFGIQECTIPGCNRKPGKGEDWCAHPFEGVSTLNHRYPAKRVGFGILTGITAVGLLAQMELAGIAGWDEERCQDAIDRWLDANAGIRVWMGRCYAEGRRYGGVWDRWGRFRPTPGIWSPHNHIRGEAERQTHSHKVQGGAQGYLKTAMGKVWRETLPTLRDWGVPCYPVLQVHDELALEVPEEHGEMAMTMVAEVLETAHKISVPIKSKWGLGANWSLAH